MYKDRTLIVCVPTLNRYDLLEKMIFSLEDGEVKPDGYVIIDNGGKLTKQFPKTYITAPSYNIGCANSWNWFIDNVPEIRLICNDDLVFYSDTIKNFIDNYDDTKLNTVIPAEMFSCFAISDKVVQQVGKFDENISPNYAYYEDNDYYHRMVLAGVHEFIVPGCRLQHEHSNTLKAFTQAQMNEHHKKFRLAQRNYISKWGGLPGEERYKTPFNI